MLACSKNFDPPSLVESVRILAIGADNSYVAPGENVALTTLAVDGRKTPAVQMAIHWLPRLCENPKGDLYYNCYPSFASQFTGGIDLTASLVAGSSFSFTMPSDAIEAHPVQAGRPTPYGVVFAFVIACAGHVEYVPVKAATESAATTPFGCFDAAHNALGPNDFVFAFMRVYAFASLRNANPVITQVTFGGAPIDVRSGITIAHCTTASEDDCAQTPVDAVVPASDQEADPNSVSATGQAEKEAIWVDYFITAGRLKTDSVLLFDPSAGQVAATSDEYAAPQSSATQTLWSVVHDNRGGVSWLAVPLHVE